MILLNDATSIIEAMYLKERLSDNKYESNIIVNPDNPFYMNKIIYVNSYNYDLTILTELAKNNIIKSRIKLSNAKFKYLLIPYRKDRINRIDLQLLGESDYTITRHDMSKLIIFQDTSGNYATILPKVIEESESKVISVFELYLSLINR